MSADEENARVPQNGEDYFADVVSEGVDGLVGEGPSYEVEGQVEICQGEVCEQQTDKLIQEFNMKKDLARDGMVRLPNLPEVHQRVDGGEKGTIQPTTTLGDKLWNRIYFVSTAFIFSREEWKTYLAHQSHPYNP